MASQIRAALDRIKMELQGREDDLKHVVSRQIGKPRVSNKEKLSRLLN